MRVNFNDNVNGNDRQNVLVGPGVTVGDLVRDQLGSPSLDLSRYRLTMNDQVVDPDDELVDGAVVTVTPQKIGLGG